MMNDNGVTLAEVLAALFVLSLLAASLSGIVQALLGNWERTSERLTRVDALLTYSEKIAEAEQQPLRGDPFLLHTTSGDTLILAAPKIDKTADCVYDLVGRRCR